MVSTSFPRDALDWRGIFMRHLVMALAINTRLSVTLWAPAGELPASVADATNPQEARWLRQLMDAGGISHLMRQGGLSGLRAPLVLLRMLADAYRRQRHVDVYHVNWLQCALPLPRDGKPALITVLGNDLKLLRLPLMPTLLRRAMRGRAVALCPNAQWMKKPLEATFGDIAAVIPVPFGIDPLWYDVVRRPVMGKPVWIAVTRLTRAKLGDLFEWSQSAFGTGERELHLFGPMQEETAIPRWIVYHGSATPEQLAAEWFPLATGLITLSRHAEGRPQVMLEAMAAGLPIVASRTHAHADVVVDRETGLLCGSPETYVAALRALEHTATNAGFGRASRHRIRSEVGTWDDCAERYRTVYEMLLARGPPS